MPIDNLAEYIESLEKEEDKKQAIFSNIYSHIKDLQTIQNYQQMKEYMKILQRAILIIKNVISSQKTRFAKNPKILSQLDKQVHVLDQLWIYSKSYETRENVSDLNFTLTGILNAINSFINSSRDISNSKNLSLAA